MSSWDGHQYPDNAASRPTGDRTAIIAALVAAAGTILAALIAFTGTVLASQSPPRITPARTSTNTSASEAPADIPATPNRGPRTTSPYVSTPALPTPSQSAGIPPNLPSRSNIFPTAPILQIWPSLVPPGSQFTVTGRGFSPGTLVTLLLFTSESTYYPIPGGNGLGVAADGSFRATVDPPRLAQLECGVQGSIAAFQDLQGDSSQGSVADARIAFPCA